MSETIPHRIDPPSTAIPVRVGRHAPASESRDRALSGDSQPDGPCFRVAREELVSGPVDSSAHSPAPPAPPVPRDAPAPCDAPAHIDSAAREDWLRLHAADLIERLQAWACDLDAREAQLNSRTSLQEHLERRFRLRQQDMNTELAEQQRSIERLRRDLETQMRRLAFQNNAG